MSVGASATLIIVVYLLALLALGYWSSHSFRGTTVDYFAASHGLGSVLLLLSVFGTTMTAFAMQGSSGEAFASGIVVFAKMASWSGIVHSACFFLIGVKLWAFGRRYGYQTQIQFFRDRFESDGIGLLLFPILSGLVIVYILTGVIGAGTVINRVTEGTFPKLFAGDKGAVPYWLATAVVSSVVLIYVLWAGVRGTAWANAFQTVIFVAVGLVTFAIIGHRLGGYEKATELVRQYNPTKLKRSVDDADRQAYAAQVAAFEADPKAALLKPHPPKEQSKIEFASYGLIPLSVAMFPHLFQLWLTAKSAKKFRLTVAAHPVLIMVVWLPCVLIGVWATSAVFAGKAVIPPAGVDPNSVLAIMVKTLAPPVLAGLLAAGILAAILGGLDAQYLCVGSMFTHDIVAHYRRRNPLTDTELLRVGRAFVALVVLVAWILSVTVTQKKAIFAIGVWCFSGFASMFPLVFTALYWRRVTKAGAYASILAGMGTWTVLFTRSHFGAEGEILVFGMLPVVTIMAASVAALIVVSLLTPPPSPTTISKFFDPPGATLPGRAGR